MEMLTIALIEDPTVTQQVTERAWSFMPKLKDRDPKLYRAGAGTKVWEVVDAEHVAQAKIVRAAPTKPIAFPVELQRIGGSDPEQVREPEGAAPRTREEVIAAIESATTIDNANAAAAGDTRKTVTDALAKRVKQLQV